MIRLYFNAAEEWPLVWSVDNGDPGTEQKFRLVHVNVEGETCFMRHGDTQPRAWIQFNNAVVDVLGDVASIGPL